MDKIFCMNKKITAIALIAIAVVVAGYWGYRNQLKKTYSDETSPATCVDKPESKAVITSLSAKSGSIGTQLEINGCNFSGFEGDENVWIENSEGVKGIMYEDEGSTPKLIKITLKYPLCTQDNSYSGMPCTTFLALNPGTYKLWTQPWGEDTKSNVVEFTIK